MTEGFRIVDTDSYVRPAIELLYEQGSGEFRGHWDELKGYLRLRGRPRPELGDWPLPSLEFDLPPAPYGRPFGHKNGASNGHRAWGENIDPDATNAVEAGVLHDNPAGRLRMLDRQGIDRQLIGPGPVPWLSSDLPAHLATGLLEAYNRYIVAYCEADPNRLKGVILVHGGDPEWSALQVLRLSYERCVAAVAICLPPGMPLDDPDLHPVWKRMTELDLPLFHHPFIEGWPNFPGHDDVWNNLVMARAAAHQWSAQRALAFLVFGGIFESYPGLRVGFGDAGAGWLPSWLCQVRGQARQLPRLVPELATDPLDYAGTGRIYVGLEAYEGEAIAASLIDLIGDDALVWQSHFPYEETNLPDAADGQLSWQRISESSKRKLLSENAERYLRIP
jgi:predicted TIM-barrel fold metal-dependent hydrolase